jgi:hypothetical protein
VGATDGPEDGNSVGEGKFTRDVCAVSEFSEKAKAASGRRHEPDRIASALLFQGCRWVGEDPGRADTELLML